MAGTQAATVAKGPLALAPRSTSKHSVPLSLSVRHDTWADCPRRRAAKLAKVTASWQSRTSTDTASVASQRGPLAHQVTRV